MSLSELPIEILWIIASSLPRQRDIYALIQTNRRLHQILEKCLHYWNAQYKHGSALPFAAKHSGLVPQLRNLLNGLDVALHRPHEAWILSPRKVRRYTYHESSEEEASESEEENCQPSMTFRGKLGPTGPYWEDISTHPLFLQKYCTPSILNIQHALVVGVQAGNTEAIQALLQFGAEVNFYRGSRAEKPFPKSTRIRFHSNRVEIDNPPLFTAVQYGHVEIVNLLLECGADPQRYTPSPLYRAVEDGRRDLISALLKYDLRSQKAALKLAVLRMDYPMVEFLLSAGLDASERGHLGLYVAEMKGHKDIAALLKLRGATVDAVSEIDRVNWAAEDGDGTDRPKYYWCSHLHTADEDIDEPE
ncbi:hypothetical protein F1880_008637 [Penicillium rolfsii]|nr:hypothetical protein F1880_008637 [Penicillium rolfsii]